MAMISVYDFDFKDKYSDISISPGASFVTLHNSVIILGVGMASGVARYSE